MFSAAVGRNSRVTHTRVVHTVHTHTQEGGLLTQKSAYSPESVFPEVLLHAKTGRVQQEAWPWSVVPGLWILDPDLLSLAIWSLGFGPWLLVFGIWYLVHGS